MKFYVFYLSFYAVVRISQSCDDLQSQSSCAGGLEKPKRDEYAEWGSVNSYSDSCTYRFHITIIRLMMADCKST